MKLLFLFIFIPVVRSKNCFVKILKHPSTRHVGLLMMFSVFNVVVPLSDFITDILTAQSFFQQGHFYWGICTMLFVFLPFLGRLLVFLLKIVIFRIKRNGDDYPNKMTEFKALCHGSPELIWHFPPLIIIRSV